MIFLKETDFVNKLDENVKAQLLNGSADAFDMAEQTAIAAIEDSLSSLYNLNAEFAKLDEERHRSLIKWCLNLSMYDLYERIPDNDLPPRVVKNYDDTIELLGKIETGKRTTTLERIVDEATGKTKTSIRWGSDKRRTH